MKRKLSLFIIIQLIVLNLYSQSLTESLGGINTNFQFYSDTVKLEVADQSIILRAESLRDTHISSNGGAGWGYGYQSYHLEFITKDELSVKTFPHKRFRNNNDRLKLIFYDSNNNSLASYLLFFDSNCLYNDDLYFYSMDLIEIPLILLDRTVKIELLRLSASKQ